MKAAVGLVRAELGLRANLAQFSLLVASTRSSAA